jgi:hypothetical protein
MTLARITLWLGGLALLGYGIAFLVAPVETLAKAGWAMTGPGAVAELRSFYGGLEVALGALLIAADLRGRRREGLILCLASYGCIGAARALGIALDGAANDFLWIALGVEALFAVMAGAALRRA